MPTVVGLVVTETEHKIHESYKNNELECGPMPNVMAALPNIGALCSMPESVANAQYSSAVQ